MAERTTPLRVLLRRFASRSANRRVSGSKVMLILVIVAIGLHTIVYHDHARRISSFLEAGVVGQKCLAGWRSRRFTRLVNAFSKKLDNLKAAVRLKSRGITSAVYT